MILKHNGIISVVSRNVITSCSSVLTNAPITPRLVSLRYSKGRVLLTVWRNGYKNSGTWAWNVENNINYCVETRRRPILPEETPNGFPGDWRRTEVRRGRCIPCCFGMRSTSPGLSPDICLLFPAGGRLLCRKNAKALARGRELPRASCWVQAKRFPSSLDSIVRLSKCKLCRRQLWPGEQPGSAVNSWLWFWSSFLNTFFFFVYTSRKNKLLIVVYRVDKSRSILSHVWIEVLRLGWYYLSKWRR